ncbi:MBL fold metallo-hydrolase [Candidatus Micrarchaeota archaeon]|nr:MBL fold metallo-hydrolase [Candidatus Micrarchaeota archaeon]
MDAGVKISGDEEEFPLLETRHIAELDRIVLSHAHLDHSGYLPYLYKQGCDAPAIMTKPTRDLIQVLLADYIRINQAASPYDEKDVVHLLKKTQMMEYENPLDGVQMYNAGHILGAAVTELETGGKKILYSGDINDRETRLLNAVKTGYTADAMIIESTYGDPLDRHPSLKDAANQLIQLIQATLERGGKVVIPTFAIGRGQEILFLLENYMRSGLLQDTPIYLDGMIGKVLRIYRHNALFLKKEVQHRILSSEDDPFKSSHYRVPQTKDRSDVLQQEKAIILATSGMLNGGPILHYLKHLGPDERNTLIFTGYQGAGTRGRQLLEGARELQLDDALVPINMQVTEAKFSGHADFQGLTTFAKSVRGLKDIFIVHGEKAKSESLGNALGKIHKSARIHVPALGEEIRL